ncbi:TlyA family RNA methyltransferase [Fusibacter ferrireducens]|uniref:TlyA family RNA methyltransferase n=1 Tax=Fusibacter ferrireducens TaxID=2785058 RepID=A0ABR9ZU47_9FIRM|nr:TlyA family RNA methyltransferase [Fusibacter ferrireducens]MBF4693678.1 TlyA family RNA methyltransferase [Fusibacter ferrireducens]
MAKERIDVLLSERKIIESREKAKRTIMAGVVYVNGQKVDKPGTQIDVDAEIEVRGNVLPYVSRGGLKLEKAITMYGVDLKDKICMDIGASTGGFTDCMLQNGAKQVFSVDVGYGQLDWKLRNDPRVVNLERTNVRYLTMETVKTELDFVSIDVSFISLKLVIPVAISLLKVDAEIVFLIKPQFEAGREAVRKSGVVRDSKVHVSVLDELMTFCAAQHLLVTALTYSPIKGPKGNIEFLAYAKRTAEKQNQFSFDTKALVQEAHEALIIE